jgi:2,4-dienoyl-CoA reductase-like NADH-dependent reductase (Old Yellow Enzyme family)
VICRMNADDFLMTDGNSPVEMQLVAGQLELAGVDAISVSAAMRDSDLTFNDHTSASPVGGWMYFAERMKKGLTIPVIAVKRMTTELGEQMVQNGQADLIAFGKAFIANPGFAGKVLEGHHEEIILCTSCCQGCYDELWMYIRSPAYSIHGWGSPRPCSRWLASRSGSSSSVAGRRGARRR